MQEVSETETDQFSSHQILQIVRIQHDPEPARFGIPRLDEIVNSALAARRTSTSNIPPSNPPPILELISQAPGSGVLHFLYLLTATAILPASSGGKDACVAIIDTDNTFSVSHLAQQLRVAIKNPQNQHEEDQHPTANANAGTEAGAGAGATEAEISTLLALSLRHVHIFRPQSQTSLLATLDSLPTYFLPTNNPNHHTTNPSTHRPLAFIALNSLPAFHWQQRAESETRAFEEETNQQQNQQLPANQTEAPAAPPPTTPSPLHPTLRTLTHTFPSTPHLHLNPSHFPRLSSLEGPLKPIPLTFSRVQTRPFLPMISVEEALREKGQRESAVRGAGWRVGSNVYVDGRAGGGMGRGMPLEFGIGSSDERGLWVG